MFLKLIPRFKKLLRTSNDISVFDSAVLVSTTVRSLITVSTATEISAWRR
jgi:hypothetical protein